ncbi:hypothetical protein PG985_005375 [Apiospora marii]|uniref:Uncharacterized protein n=1 Tax=Apiospora marii TaxID=335849 RepID=A0ABR1SBS4_9PEZI
MRWGRKDDHDIPEGRNIDIDIGREPAPGYDAGNTMEVQSGAGSQKVSHAPSSGEPHWTAIDTFCVVSRDGE